MRLQRFAAIDIGTNSVLLLVAERQGAALVPIVERATVTRLGEGVDRTRRLAPGAAERTLACLGDYGAAVREAGVAALDVVGTSALRDAEGGTAFLEAAATHLGRVPRVIAGDEEADLAFAGATSGLRVAGPRLVVDVGGGSTEVVRGDESGVLAATSFDVGSVRLTERHLEHDPPAPEELAAVRVTVRDELARGPAPPPAGTPVLGIAGTVTTLFCTARGIAPYDAARVHGATTTRGELGDLVAALALEPSAARARRAGLDPRRADVVVAGGCIVDEVLAWAGLGRDDVFTVSDRGVRWALVERLAHAARAGE